jgi:hypothetical protein
LSYWKPEFMGPSIEFILAAYRGKAKPYAVNEGTTPFTASPEYAPKAAAAAKSAAVSVPLAVTL